MTEGLRVMQVIDSLAAGGAERMAVRLSNALAAEVDLSVLCTTRRGGPLEASVDASVGQLRLGRRGPVGARSLEGFRRFVVEQEIDVVHAHSTSIFFVSAALAGLRDGPLLVWHDHNPRLGERKPLHARFAGSVADLVLAVSDEIASWQASSGVPSSKIHVVPNFVENTGSVDPADDLPGTLGRRVVHVANLRPEKNHLGLLRSFARVVGAIPDAHLCLVGDTTNSSHVSAVRLEIEVLGLSANVSMLGSRSDVPSVLAGCDLGVLPSLHEGFPLAVIEYGIAGLPVIAAAVGQVPEISANGTLVVLVDPWDEPQLAGALIEMLDDVKARERMGASFRDHVLARYTSSAVIPRLLDLYASARRSGTGAPQ